MAADLARAPAGVQPPLVALLANAANRLRSANDRQCGRRGYAWPKQLEHFPNLVTMFLTRAREKRDQPFLWKKIEGQWQSISYAEAARQVAALADSLKRIGLKPGDRVMLVSENRPEWLIADLGIMAAGCVTVPTYTTNTTRDHQHILANSEASAVIVSTQKLARTLVPAVLFASECKHIISIDDIITGQSPDVAPFHHWKDLISGGSDIGALEQRMAEVKRDDLACIIYTSGTGGAPRGVMQHHGMILHNVEGCIDVIANDFGWDDEVFLSFLPASHAYEHIGRTAFPDRAGRADLLRRKPREACRQHRGGPADDHGRRAAPVRNAARQDHEAGRKRRRPPRLSDEPRPIDRNQALCRHARCRGTCR